ncbi:uncharacterized protein LOC122530473 [Frieseomelitta varia]|uniref:uncharacterized protein LOC122530473 n=1 Tax=Frieseomelitta varia TaxID=561572 RepID=UPI001CB68336|nr:uncharacterized protein LOC122530473 [Frieseomelitta varia]
MVSWTLSRLTRKLFPEQLHTYSKLANQREIRVASGRIRNCASLYRLIFLQSHDITFIDTEEQLDFCGEKKRNDWFGRGKIIASSVVRTIKNNKTMNQLTVVNSWKKC